MPRPALYINSPNPENPRYVEVSTIMVGQLADLQRAVGGYVEPIPSSKHVTIWVNEEGKYTCPPNLAATLFWEQFDPYECVRSGDYIAGPVVVQGGNNSRGFCNPTPKEVWQWAANLIPMF